MRWAALVVVLAVGAAVFALLMPVPFEGRVSQAIGDLVHAPLFGTAALVTMLLLDRRRPLQDDFGAITHRGITVTLVVSAIGVVMEILQQSFGRSATWHDAMSNTLGIIAAVLCFIGWRWNRFRRGRKHVSRACFLAAGCLLALSWYRPSVVLRDVINVDRGFPMLASFESPAEIGRFWFNRCEGHRTTENVSDGKYAMEVLYEPSSFPSATLIELHEDWSAAESLQVDVTLVSPHNNSVTFMIKVLDGPRQDDESDTYQGSWTLEPGQKKRIRIPREELLKGPDSRELDLSRIAFVDFAVLKPSEPTRICIDRVRVELGR